ncbi:MAG TPA: META domain-containing protein [Steroidobacteraceae bacterium]|jgi:heat shock protein HslJ|nr:META domain-containing protein [Steroidobacteraceae bacterium]
MKPGLSLLRVIVIATVFGALAGCASAPAPEIANAAASSLTDTPWKLTQLGGEVVNSPPGAREINLVLQAQDQRVTGFAGCNSMMGSYVLNGGEIRFDQIGSTRMACEGRMEIEQRYLAMFARAARWEITGTTLRLLDSAGKTVATFEASIPQAVAA